MPNCENRQVVPEDGLVLDANTKSRWNAPPGVPLCSAMIKSVVIASIGYPYCVGPTLEGTVCPVAIASLSGKPITVEVLQEATNLSSQKS